jgi:ribosomal protein S18 acetylase RimI-like enzyme
MQGGQGIRPALLKHLLEAAKNLYPAVSLGVSPNNQAIRLYERLGFKTVHVRNEYPVMRKAWDS